MLLGRLLARSGQHAEAIEHYEAVVKLQPAYTAARLNLASALSNQRRYAEALAQATDAVARDPASFDAHFHLATLLLIQNRPSDAIEPLRAAVRLRPEDQRAQELLEKVSADVGGAGQ
jgi:tetratricopeptide (TPR) repeat protein